jgi:hypothetical protein
VLSANATKATVALPSGKGRLRIEAASVMGTGNETSTFHTRTAATTGFTVGRK